MKKRNSPRNRSEIIKRSRNTCETANKNLVSILQATWLEISKTSKSSRKKHQSHPDWNTDGCITMPSYESPHSWWHPHIWRHRWWSSFRRSKLRLLFHERGRRQPTPSYKPTHFRTNWRTTAEASSLAKKLHWVQRFMGIFFEKYPSHSWYFLVNFSLISSNYPISQQNESRISLDSWGATDPFGKH